MLSTHMGYLENCLIPAKLDKVIKLCSAAMIASGLDQSIDTIVVKGVSGLTVGSILSFLFKKNLFVIRKGEFCHSPSDLEGSIKENFIVVDDIISTGDTVDSVLDSVFSKDITLKCLSIFLWNCHCPDYGCHYDYCMPNRDMIKIPLFQIGGDSKFSEFPLVFPEEYNKILAKINSGELTIGLRNNEEVVAQ